MVKYYGSSSRIGERSTRERRGRVQPLHEDAGTDKQVDGPEQSGARTRRRRIEREYTSRGKEKYK